MDVALLPAGDGAVGEVGHAGALPALGRGVQETRRSGRKGTRAPSPPRDVENESSTRMRALSGRMSGEPHVCRFATRDALAAADMVLRQKLPLVVSIAW